MLAEEGEHLLPAVDRRGLAVLRPIHREEGVAGIVVSVELVGLAELLQRLLGLPGVLRRGPGVLDAEETQQRAAEILRELDRRDRLARCELLGLGGDAAAVAVDGRVDAAQGARREIRLPPARAIADDANL